ncbi:hypothetical protein CEW87_10505 [Parazoarcus communis]|uniref:Glycosyltransferase subfamily 4-like N-terminal domain-containing protein n=1 Tax=Parazoarcus communis TaxID=41977 RepID=A0A2U8H2H4_9RHOO|nr:hypothetical protein CEW87_10505 [Parazoarcus communis]
MSRLKLFTLSHFRTVRDTLSGYSRYARLRISGLGAGSSGGQQGNRHLLLLAWLFPPTVSGGVYRPLSFARRAADLGWQVTVIAGPEPDVPSHAGRYLLDRLPSSVRVVRISESTLRPSYRFFPYIDGGFGNVIDTLERAIADDISTPSLIFASGPPFHNFVVGWHLSRRLKRPLVLDYRDEWTQCPFDFVGQGNSDFFWERKCLEQASSVVFTTRSFIEQAQIAFPEADTRKFVHIPNGFDFDDLKQVAPNATQAVHPHYVLLSFLGALGPHTPPDGFLAAVRRMLAVHPNWRERLRIQFVGERHRSVDRMIADSDLSDIISLRDQVSKPEAMEIMRDSSALIAFNPISLRRYIPGKLFDYIASGRPILVYGEGGEVASIVRELDAGAVVPENDIDRLREALSGLSSRPLATDESERKDWLKRHERSVLADRLIEELDNLVAKRH